jgi:general secretion pathway protein A
MYNKFYQLRESPFEITPDPKFLFLSDNHREALAHLVYAVKEKKGFTVLTGEVGTGKTTLIHSLLSQLNGHTRAAFLFNPNLNTLDFLEYICEDLGLKGHRRSKGRYIADLYQLLLDYYSQGVNVLLIIDEAQRLRPELLEEVRLLTNLETPKGKLLQVILVGQPELSDTLDRHEFRQLRQRISLRYHINTLSASDTQKYIEKRMEISGTPFPNVFSPKALNKIFKYSKGIPRLINVVCDRALLMGYTLDQKIIGEKVIKGVIDNLEGGKESINRAKRGFGRGWIIAGFIILVLCLLLGIRFVSEDFWSSILFQRR